MRLFPHFPKPPLSRFIELIWAVEGVSVNPREKVLPNGAIELLKNKRDPRNHTKQHEKEPFIRVISCDFVDRSYFS